MLINMLCAVGGVVIGAAGMGIVLWNMYREYRDYPLYVNTPSYEECEELNEIFDGDGGIYFEG